MRVVVVMSVLFILSLSVEVNKLIFGMLCIEWTMIIGSSYSLVYLAYVRIGRFSGHCLALH